MFCYAGSGHIEIKICYAAGYIEINYLRSARLDQITGSGYIEIKFCYAGSGFIEIQFCYAGSGFIEIQFCYGSGFIEI